ncbi:MAG: Mrp/NBP35 family ATP-binding protein [Acidobacteriota bacterium]|nr:Mrp/NBP35 family ATP-binding protein [Acidobacteriota bacterium]
MAIDPRLAAVEKRLDSVERILAVTGGKGGIGKSVVATTLSIVLARAGRSSGLLDLDLTGPTAHVLLGAQPKAPREEFGVRPQVVDGVSFMSVACFSGTSPAPLRGEDVTNVLLEILAITNWGKLDTLTIDMPPGLGDAALDVVRLIPRAEHLVVATGSRVVLETVRRNVEVLNRYRARILGMVGNMDRGDDSLVRELAAAHGVRFLGSLPYDETIESRVGIPDRLGDSDLARALERCVREEHPGPA